MSDRELSADEAGKLLAGADHYRAYVGPPDRYGPLGLSQTALLHRFGLKETHKVLDFGCGSLRLGRLLIPFLREGGYFGIEPNEWLVDAGFARELGEDARALKQPRFSADASFDCGVFGEAFDFIVAQSIITHSGHRETRRLFESAARALKPSGVFLLTYIPAQPDPAQDSDLPDASWTYPHNVSYPTTWVTKLAADQGLEWEVLDWPHPSLTWASARRA